MIGFIRGALGLALAATAGFAVAQPYGPPLAGGPAERVQSVAYHPPMRDDMPGPDAQAGPRHAQTPPPPGRYDAYGYDRLGLTADGYDRNGYDAHGYDRYGFDPDGYSADGFDRYGYDQNGRDRYGRRAPAQRAEAPLQDETRAYSDRGDRAEGYSEGYGYSYGTRGGSYGDGAYDDRAYAGDRYGPARDDRYAYDPEVPSHGGAMQHFADPRCSTCGPIRADCGCRGVTSYGGGYETGSVSISPAFFYDNGGVGPIPDGGYYGGGYAVVGGGSGAYAASSAYASSSSRVSIGIRTGGGGHGGGHHGGGCNCGGGHK